MTHELVSIVIFDDNTYSEATLHKGTFRDCEQLAESIPAVCYSGNKKIIDSFLGIREMPNETSKDAHLPAL